MEDFFKIGIITATHGLHGEVKVFPTTDDVRRFKKLKKVTLDTGKTQTSGMVLEIESVKFFKQFAILKLKGAEIPESRFNGAPKRCRASEQGRIFYC